MHSFCTAGVTIAVFSSVAFAQCDGQWLPGRGTRGLSSEVLSQVVLPGGDVLFAGSFTNAGGVPAYYLARYNPVASTWSSLEGGASSPGNPPHVMLLLPNGDLLVGGQLTFQTSTGPARCIGRYSFQTGTWSALGTGVWGPQIGTGPFVSALALLPDGRVVVGGHFDSAGDSPAANLALVDPSTNTWTPLSASNSSSFGIVTSILPLPGGAEVMIGGGFDRAGGAAATNIARVRLSDGAGFPLAAGFSGTPNTFYLSDPGHVIVGGQFTAVNGIVVNNIAGYDLSSGAWSAIGSGVTGTTGIGPFVSSIVAAGDGTLLIAGTFTAAGGTPIRNLARYNPSTGAWSALGPGMDPAPYSATVSAVSVIPGGDLIIGGSFSRAGGLNMSNVARFSPGTNAFLPLADGTDWILNCLCPLPGDRVLVGGGFTNIWGVPSRSLAVYDPRTLAWSGLDSQIDGEVTVLAPNPSGDALVAGAFTTVGGVAAPHLARYSPATGQWTALGASTPGGLGVNSILAMVTLPTLDVVIGGQFANVGGVPAANTARYSPSSNAWTAVGQGLPSAVNALLALPGGDLLATGSFGASRYNTAANTWAGLTSTGTGYTALLLTDGDVIVGGDFAASGGFPSACIARYRPSTSELLPIPGLATNNRVRSLALAPSGDVIVYGTFTSVGGTPANNIARYHPESGSWSALGTGLSGGSGIGQAVVLTDGDVLAVGNHLIAGGQLSAYFSHFAMPTADFNHDGDFGTDADIEAFFACLGGNCCPTCGSADFNGDGDVGTDADIEAFFRVLAGGGC